MNRSRVVLNADLTGPTPNQLSASGVVHADVSVEPAELTASEAEAFRAGSLSTSWVLRCGEYPASAIASGLAVAELGGVWFDQLGDVEAIRAGADLARNAGLARCVSVIDAAGSPLTLALLEAISPDRIAVGDALFGDCAVEDGRVSGLGEVGAAIRDRGLPVAVDDPRLIRVLGDAGLRLTFDGAEIEPADSGLDPGEVASARERTAGAAFVAPDIAAGFVAEIRAGCDHQPARLVHMAERARWRDAAALGAYLPAEFEADGFIHLSALAQVLTPANRFYRGRDDLVALVIDAHSLVPAVIWEPGTGTTEYFPHLYGALNPDLVVAEVPMTPAPDGSFVMPAGLARSIRGSR